MPASTNDRQALDRERAALLAQQTDLKATLALRANRADQAGLVVQDIARSSLRNLIQRACIQCHRVITAATLKLFDTKYKAHLRKCRRAVVPPTWLDEQGRPLPTRPCQMQAACYSGNQMELR